MRIDVTEAELAAMAYLSAWALQQARPPQAVITAADAVGHLVWAIRQAQIDREGQSAHVERDL